MSNNRTPGNRNQIELLRKVLSLERRKGFDDSAMSGGLEAFVHHRAQDSVDDDSERILFRDLARIFSGYSTQSPADRVRRVERAERLLGSEPQDMSAQSRPAQPRPVAHAPQRKSWTRRPVTLRSLDDPVSKLPGVGENREKQLANLGIRTVRDVLYFVPRRHEDYSRLSPIIDAHPNREYTLRGHVQSIDERQTRTGKALITVRLADNSGAINVLFFNPYVAKQIQPGAEIAVSGRVEVQRGEPCLRQPEWELITGESLSTSRLVPFYPLTRGLFQKQLRLLSRRALDSAREHIEDPLDPSTRERHNLMDLATALEALHYPRSLSEHRQARARLAFDEFLVLQIGLLRRKADWQEQPGQSFPLDGRHLSRFIGSLPFSLTNAQNGALNEVIEDLQKPKSMSRLLQGDVGSGKTVVAAAAAHVVIGTGAQVAVLAPTEILAEQHERTFTKIFRELPRNERPNIALLTGSTPAGRRREIDDGLASGEIDLLVGTHAILEDRISFKTLGLAIIDEQHRFGVRQRASLRAKGLNPDILVMTATPIPRSLALVLHGDLDVSIIDELPPGRQPIITTRRSARQRGDVHAFIRHQVHAGRQAFIIYPLVEESDRLDVKAATNEHEHLSAIVFPDLRVGLLHGRMKPAEKDAVMTQFRDHELDILVATSVIEVGIDVPNATVMVIEGAERFGLSQLHQFRGRVGRGAEKSYCVLITSDDSEGATSQKRLDAIVETQDGFRLAEIDLELRGPGEFFGTRQSGIPELAFAVLGDMITLHAARSEAQGILERDPDLRRNEHRVLREFVERFWVEGMGDLS